MTKDDQTWIFLGGIFKNLGKIQVSCDQTPFYFATYFSNVSILGSLEALVCSC